MGPELKYVSLTRLMEMYVYISKRWFNIGLDAFMGKKHPWIRVLTCACSDVCMRYYITYNKLQIKFYDSAGKRGVVLVVVFVFIIANSFFHITHLMFGVIYESYVFRVQNSIC